MAHAQKQGLREHNWRRRIVSECKWPTRGRERTHAHKRARPIGRTLVHVRNMMDRPIIEQSAVEYIRFVCHVLTARSMHFLGGGCLSTC